MRQSRALFGEGSRSTLIVLLLLVSLVLVSLLAAQAYYAARSHRAMAERVLRDYAALAADEFTRRAAQEIGFYGYYLVITALRDAAAPAPAGGDLPGKRPPSAKAPLPAKGPPSKAPLPAPADLAARMSEDTRRAVVLARTCFHFDPLDGRMETAGAPLEPREAEWLRGALRERGTKPLAAGRRYDARYALIDGKLHGFVTIPVDNPASARPVLVGFTVDRDALSKALQRAFERGPLLPPSLGGKEIGKDAVQVSLVDPFGGEVLRAGAPFSPFLGVEKTLGSDYNGILEKFMLRAAVDPAAAPRLAIGGLPRSRLPLLLTLLVLTAGLMLTAIFQLRRERALNRMRSDFVSRVSHELRTPLTQIRMFAETLLLDRVRSEDERLRSLAIIDRESRRLSNLVENVLRFSRGERGEVHLAPSPHDLGPLVRDLLDEFRPLAERRGALIAARVPDRAVATVDDDALRQILLNLLDNAVKYGPEGQEVRVGVSNGPSGVRIWVDDEGPGIPSSDRERIWQPFYRLETHTKSAIVGTGIGLAVVRNLVALQGGRSWVEPGERDGARFVVEFPTTEPVPEHA